MKKNYILLLVLIIIAACNLSIAQSGAKDKLSKYVLGNGVQASNKFIEYIQPDGSMLNIKLKGDGAVHWAEAEDGYTLLANSLGFYEYAKLNANNELVASGITAQAVKSRSNKVNEILNTVPKGLFFSKNQIKHKLANYNNDTRKGIDVELLPAAFPHSGTNKLLVLLVQFPDAPYTYSINEFNDLMNKENYGNIGSFKDYYYSNSGAQLTVNSTVSGIYTAKNNYAYYGGNDDNGNDSKVDELIIEALDAADDSVDYSEYDNNNDGVVDALYVIYAGGGEAESGEPDHIWPHASGLWNATYDGVQIPVYACSSELSNTWDGWVMTGIGTICHEFGHALGLPDFYDTDYEGTGGDAEGLGSWDLMSGGNYNGGGARPANHNPLSRYLLGWNNFENLTTDGSVTLNHSFNEGAKVYLIESSETEGFIIENRQREGFDADLPGNGMLVYHYDEDYMTEDYLWNNNINANPDHQGFDIEEADASVDYWDRDGDPFPGASNITLFNDETTPSSLLWSGVTSGFSINSIALLGTGEVSFDIDFNLDNYNISFTVTDTLEASIEGAEIVINKQTLTTDANGNAGINIKEGAYNIEVSAEGYETYTGGIVVNDTSLNFSIELVEVLVPNKFLVTFEVGDIDYYFGNAKVSILDTTLITESNGLASIELENGTYSYSVSFDGYEEYTNEITVNGAELYEVIIMTPITSVIMQNSEVLEIYPSPANNVITIKSGSNIYGVEIRSITGRLMSTTKANVNSNKLTHDISDLHPGIYIVNVATEKANFVKKILVE